MDTKKNIQKYINNWKNKGYPNDIPDEVPQILMKLGLAPSYKAIALALLQNDMNLESLGFTPKKSIYYSILKKIEIDARNNS